MVTNVFSLTCHDGKLAAGFDWALRVTAYIKQQFPGSDMEVVRNIGGPFYELHMVTESNRWLPTTISASGVRLTRATRSLPVKLRNKGCSLEVVSPNGCMKRCRRTATQF